MYLIWQVSAALLMTRSTRLAYTGIYYISTPSFVQIARTKFYLVLSPQPGNNFLFHSFAFWISFYITHSLLIKCRRFWIQRETPGAHIVRLFRLHSRDFQRPHMLERLFLPHQSQMFIPFWIYVICIVSVVPGEDFIILRSFLWLFFSW
jgi:hypothetical protein